MCSSISLATVHSDFPKVLHVWHSKDAQTCCASPAVVPKTRMVYLKWQLADDIAVMTIPSRFCQTLSW